MEAVIARILEMSLAGSIVILLALVLRLIFKKGPKWIPLVLWGIVALRLLCPLFIESGLGIMPRVSALEAAVSKSEPTEAPMESPAEAWVTESAPPMQSAAPVKSAAPTQSAAPARTEEALPTAEWHAPAAVSTKEPGSPLPPSSGSTKDRADWKKPAFFIWLAGVCAMTAYAIISYTSLRARLAAAVKRTDGVYESEFVKTPFLLGLLKPRVYLPFGMDERELKYVIAHERAHMKNGDHLTKAIGFLALSLHWFNPLCWLAYALFCRDLELACDERAVRGLELNERAEYSQALLTLSTARRRITACPLAFGEGDAKRRIKAVLNYKKPVVKVVVWALVLAALLAVFASCKGNTFFGDYFAGKSMRDKVKTFGLPADESFAEAFYGEFAGERYPKLSNSLAALEKDLGVHLCRILAIADGNCFFTAYREDDPGTLVLCSMTTEGANHKEIASTVPDGSAAAVGGYGDSFHSSGGAFDYSSFKAYYYRGGIVLRGREGIVYEYDLKTGKVKGVPSEDYVYPTADSTIEWVEDRCIIKGEGACELTKDEIVEGCPEMKQLYELAKEEGHERAESDFFCGYCCCDGKAFIVTRPMSRYGFSFGALFRFEPETKRFKFVNIIYTDGFPYVYPVPVVEAEALETVGTPLPTASPGSTDGLALLALHNGWMYVNADNELVYGRYKLDSFVESVGMGEDAELTVLAADKERPGSSVLKRIRCVDGEYFVSQSLSVSEASGTVLDETFGSETSYRYLDIERWDEQGVRYRRYYACSMPLSTLNVSDVYDTEGAVTEVFTIKDDGTVPVFEDAGFELCVHDNLGLTGWELITQEDISSATALRLSGSIVKSIADIDRFPALKELTVDGVPAFKLSALAEKRNIRRLSLLNCGIGDIAFISGMDQLEAFTFYGDSVPELTPLALLRRLGYLSINSRGEADIAPIKELPLETLIISRARIKDPSVIAGITSLNSLCLEGCGLKDISFLSRLTSLTELELANNDIEDIEPLSRLTRLKYLGLDNNLVSDISPLSGLAGLKSAVLSWNPIPASQRFSKEGFTFYPNDYADCARWETDLDGDGEKEYFCVDLNLLKGDLFSFAWLETGDHRRIGDRMRCGTGHVAFGTYALVNSPEYGPCILSIAPEFRGEYYGYSLLKPVDGRLETVYSEQLYSYDDDGVNSYEPTQAANYQRRLGELIRTGSILITTDRAGVMEGALYEVDPSLPGGERPLEITDECCAVISSAGCAGNALEALKADGVAERFMVIEGKLRYDIEVNPYTGE